MEETNDIEIGVTVNVTLYLTLMDYNSFKVPFRSTHILDVKGIENGSIITYAELSSTFSSSHETVEYIVCESKEEIEKALDDAKLYKQAGLDGVSAVLKK